MSTPWVGLDIGGANLKAAHTSGWSQSCSFPMWKQHRSLAVSIGALLEECPAFSGVALTMTGELADCFATRAEGVAAILEQVTSVLPSSWVRVYTVDGTWLSVPQAARQPWDVAASNWHGLARYCQRFATDALCMLFDIGSTTTDIVPLNRESVCLTARTDSQRLQVGSLVYTGVERSNVVGIVRELKLHESMCPVMNELFATTLDVYTWLGLLPERDWFHETADMQPATRVCSRYRLARVVGEDGSTLTDSEVQSIAIQIAQSQEQLIARGLESVIANCEVPHRNQKRTKGSIRTEPESRTMRDVDRVILSGHGDFLIEAVLRQMRWGGEIVRLNSEIGVELSRCAPAYAIAILASEEIREDSEFSDAEK